MLPGWESAAQVRSGPALQRMEAEEEGQPGICASGVSNSLPETCATSHPTADLTLHVSMFSQFVE